MKLVKVDALPEYERAPYKWLNKELERFMQMECKYARVELSPGDYSNPYSAYNAINSSARKSRLPIKAGCVNGVVYLIRKDL